MKNNVGKAVVVASEASPELGEMGRTLAKELKKRKVRAEFKSAKDSLIPDLAPFDLLLFGAAAGEKLSSGDYRELFRSLQGVNFAGRKGAFFTVENPSTFKALGEMVKDSDLTILEPGLCLDKGEDGSSNGSIARWVDGLLRQLRKG